jgi:hypothetical protein
MPIYQCLTQTDALARARQLGLGEESVRRYSEKVWDVIVPEPEQKEKMTPAQRAQIRFTNLFDTVRLNTGFIAHALSVPVEMRVRTGSKHVARLRAWADSVNFKFDESSNFSIEGEGQWESRIELTMLPPPEGVEYPIATTGAPSKPRPASGGRVTIDNLHFGVLLCAEYGFNLGRNAP